MAANYSLHVFLSPACKKECVVVIFLPKYYFSQNLCLFIAVPLPFSSDTTLGLGTILWLLYVKDYSQVVAQ